MTTQQTIQLAEREGIRLRVQKGELVWEGRRDPSALLLANLKMHKAALMANLRPPQDEEDRALLRQAGIAPDEQAVTAALRVFGGKVRAVRGAGSKTWFYRKGTKKE